MNKKGFTLVELLAVIVILAVVMLIAVTAVGPLMARARKNSLGSEGLALIKAATSKYSEEGIKGADADFTPTTSVCYNIKYLCEKGYFEKGCGDDGYSGSVLVKYNNGSYEYYFWLSNGTYVFNAATEDNYGNIDDTSVVYDGNEASTDCGQTIPGTTPSEVMSSITVSNSAIVSSVNSVVTYNETTTGGSTVWMPKTIDKIHFKIDDVTYTAEEDMTWGEWATSSYNTSEYSIIRNYDIGKLNSQYCGPTVYKGTSSVQKSSKIINNTNYTVSNICIYYLESTEIVTK